MSESNHFPPVDFATAFNAFDNLGTTIEGGEKEIHLWQDLCRFCLEQIPPHRITKVLAKVDEVLRPRLTEKGEASETDEAFDLIAELVKSGSPYLKGPGTYLSQVQLEEYEKLLRREHGQGPRLTTAEEGRLMHYRRILGVMEGKA